MNQLSEVCPGKLKIFMIWELLYECIKMAFYLNINTIARGLLPKLG